MHGRLSHIRQRGKGDPGWGQTQRWSVPGATRSVSYYDVPSEQRASNTGNQIRDGVHTMVSELPLSEPTMTRQPRVSALFDSLPNSAFFQGYFMTGWSGLLMGWTADVRGSRTLHQNFNPHMQGAAELHPATTYDPYPSPAALYPKVV